MTYHLEGSLFFQIKEPMVEAIAIVGVVVATEVIISVNCMKYFYHHQTQLNFNRL